jgi:recombination protein RecR
LVFYLLKSEDNISLGEASLALKEGIINCSSCQNFTTDTVCKICQNPNRSDSIICVVSQPLDIVAIEKTGLYKGKYHVLHGVISPVDGIGPDDIEIDSLMARIEKHSPEEIILATNPNLEGETTALYILRKLKDQDIAITKLAHGLPMGGDLEYADQMTLGRALDNRQTF